MGLVLGCVLPFATYLWLPPISGSVQLLEPYLSITYVWESWGHTAPLVGLSFEAHSTR